MPETNRTKRAIAGAFKDLLKEVPFSKITVAEICKRSGISRKSFYYHFIDKYDLVNWIFDRECPDAVFDIKEHTDLERLEALSRFFYENRDYYRAVFQYRGQNSLVEHMEELGMELFRGLIPQDLLKEAKENGDPEYLLHFFSDALLAALDRWLQEPDPMSPEDFLRNIELCVRIMDERRDVWEEDLEERA